MNAGSSDGEGPSPNPLFVWVRDAAAALDRIGAGSPRLEAEHLMAAALRMPRIRLWVTDVPPTPDQIDLFEHLLARRLAREPLQYVLGTAEFAGFTLQVGPGCFIPRSETEVLVERVEERLRAAAGRAPDTGTQKRGSGSSRGPGPAQGPAGGALRTLVDVGTGSGAILLALLRRFPEALGIGVDRSGSALEWARRNAEACGCARRARFVRGSLLEWCARGDAAGAVDAVVSNPPYIREDEVGDLAAEIADHEPREALFSGADGLDHIRPLILDAASVLKPGGVLALEIGMDQGEAVRRLLRPEEWEDAAILPDLAGRPRVVLATRSRPSRS